MHKRQTAHRRGAGSVSIAISEQESSSRTSMGDIGRGLDIVRSAVLTLKSAAAYLGISTAHLSNVINGKIPGLPQLRCARIGRRILIKRNERMISWIEPARNPFLINGNI
jgi:hypothetical protein